MEVTKKIGIWGFVTRLVSNNARLINDQRYFEGLVMESLRTDIYKIDHVSDDASHDAEMIIHDRMNAETSVRFEPGRVEAVGDFTRLEQTCPDKRYSLFGNLGLFFKFALAGMEQKGLFSFHASTLYRPDDRRLLVLVGGPGAGKTVFLLAAVPMGYRVLSAEMTHCRIDDGVVRFYKGALFDNIRVGNFVEDFPEAIDFFKIKIPQVNDVWAHKISVDMTQVATSQDIVVDPNIVVLLPKVEAGRGEPVITPITNPQVQARFLFQNLSEKIASSFLLYDECPVASFDRPAAAARRYDFVRQLLPGLTEVKSILTEPRACMKGV
jgi:hypothetical protein